MILRRTILTLLGLACTLVVDANPTYRTQRLARLAKELQLVLPEGLGANSCVDSVAQCRGVPVLVRTNAVGEVSHLGYRLLPNDVREAFHCYAAMDFLERYLLEEDLLIGDDGFYSRSRLVHCAQGNLHLLMRDLTEAKWNVVYTARRSYRFVCSIGPDTVDVAFPADAQLLMGADSKEQEEIFERELDLVTASDSFPDYTRAWRELLPELPRDTVLAASKDTVPDVLRDTVPDSTQVLTEEPPLTLPTDSVRTATDSTSISIINEGSYLSEEIRSDLYVVQHEGNVTLLNDTTRNIKSMGNLLLTGDSRQTIPVRLTVDKYGYTRSLHLTTLARLISLLKSENCRLYLGVKSLKEGTLSCTLFVLNEDLAYSHVFSIEAPLSLLSGSVEPIKALCYLYIPLQNVTESYFRAGYNQ